MAFKPQWPFDAITVTVSQMVRACIKGEKKLLVASGPAHSVQLTQKSSPLLLPYFVTCCNSNGVGHMGVQKNWPYMAPFLEFRCSQPSTKFPHLIMGILAKSSSSASVWAWRKRKWKSWLPTATVGAEMQVSPENMPFPGVSLCQIKSNCTAVWLYVEPGLKFVPRVNCQLQPHQWFTNTETILW